MGAVCLHPGSGGGAQGFVPASRSAAAILCRLLGKGGGWNDSNHFSRGRRSSLGSRDSKQPRQQGGGIGGRRPSLASAPRGVGGGATRGTGIGKERLFSAPW